MFIFVYFRSLKVKNNDSCGFLNHT
ncbi:CLUMA_CG000121, isoform A [Clunio marinus]|uniref:CLUMA_CG000121, isoform A n=1 Tax=Clunio marinus TaxID=568069 RepID=A0A1J1HK19_9DIPT|nr:CLUMA_CG000121, isoform A [Clunio marinus]